MKASIFMSPEYGAISTINMIKILLTFFLFNSALFVADSDSSNDYYQIGIDYLNQGETREALNTWIQAKSKLQQEGEADFRIGVSFIQLVTETQKEHLYPIASEIYLWGLDVPLTDKYSDYVKQEIERLKPIAGDATYSEWMKLFNNNDSAVLTSLKEFWISNDPALATSMNERLIEHWERIAYARENFTRTKNTVYDTDDRGLVYVQYGRPDSTASGLFRLNNTKVQFFSREIIRQQNEERDRRRMSPQAMDVNTDGATAAMIESYYMDNLAKAATDRVLSTRISTDYEIWIYDRQQVFLPENLIYIFGTNANTGRYGIVSSPEDFIPQASFRNRDLRVGNYRFNIGSILQLSLYDDLKFIDDKFNDVYYDLYDRLMSDQSIITQGASDYLRERYSKEFESNRSSAPAKVTEYDRYFRNVNTSIRTYDFLNDQLEPKKIVFVYSEPHNALYSDYVRFLDDEQNLTGPEPAYHLRHRVTLYDDHWNVINFLNDFPVISFEDDESSGEFYPSFSIFTLPVDDNFQNLTISSSLFNETYASIAKTAYENLRTPQHLIAESSKNFSVDDEEFKNQLNSSKFEVSDIIIGTRGDSEFDENLLIPFYVPHKKVFSGKSDLYFMFEVYNIPITSEANYGYRIDVQVNSKQDESLIRRLFRMDSSPEEKISLNIDSNKPISRQILSIDIGNYDSGSYTLELKIYSEEHEEIIEKTRTFSIL